MIRAAPLAISVAAEAESIALEFLVNAAACCTSLNAEGESTKHRDGRS